MKLEDLLNTRPEDLADRQAKELKNAAVQRLQQVADWLNHEKFENVEKAMDFSPSGDGYGCENNFISFADIHKDLIDLGDVVERLKELKNIQS